MLRLSAEHRRAILDHAQRESPRECCGILLGVRHEENAEVTAIVPCPNASPSPLTRYSISPEALIAAQKNARSAGLDILGFYHSHPRGPALPSPTDLQEANWPGCSYVIANLQQEVRSYLLTTKDGALCFREELLA